jgi:hypothetical protein
MTEGILSGAQFSRHVGTDPEKWAERFMALHMSRDRRKPERLAFVTAWFRDAMEAAVAEHERQHGYALDVVDAKVRGLISDAEWEKVRAAMQVALKAATSE